MLNALRFPGRLDFGDPLLRALTAHLAPAALRIGGTDQNSLAYDVHDQSLGAPCPCGHRTPECTMTAGYWATVMDFANATGLPLVFGLNRASVGNANALVYHTAHQNYTPGVHAYSPSRFR